jgi:hypothetical protein
VATQKRFLFPVKALAKRFRGKLHHGLRALRAVGDLRLDGPCAELADAAHLESPRRRDDRQVRFRTRDNKHASLTPEVFVERFLLHVLPRRFVKIRHFGLMAARHAIESLSSRSQVSSLSPSHVAPASLCACAFRAAIHDKADRAKGRAARSVMGVHPLHRTP